jgi:hypothetical protein
MLAAVDALLVDPALAGVPDSVRLSAVTLAAKTNAASLDAALPVTELGRWIGLEAQTVRSEVRPRLQRGVAASVDVEAEPAPGADRGRTLGVRWQVEALRAARHEGGLDDPLRLSKPEFAVLLRLCEAVFGPGWVHTGGRVTPPGLLGQRTGGGAATDRLALLLLVLHARPDGSVRLCSGAVQRRYGRAAATVARLLGCKSAGGRAVLERLVAEGVVELPGGWQGQLVIPAVREAYGRLRTARRAQGRPGGRFFGRSASDVSAPRDQDAPKAPPGAEYPQVTAGQETPESGNSGSDVFTSLHSGHSPVVTAGSVGAGDCGGCSGSAVDGDRGRRGCACVREDRPAPGDQADTGPAAAWGRGPLRGEQPTIPRPTTTTSNNDRTARRNAAGSVLGEQLPEDLAVALEPVALLWERLKRDGARQLVADVARAELGRLTGVLGIERPAGAREAAERVLADRLNRRLSDEGGTGAVRDVVGWMQRRGLPTRGCDDRCDDGFRLDLGRPCEWCATRCRDRQHRRWSVIEAVAAEMPQASPEQRQAEVERRLRQEVASEGASTALRHEHAARERAERQARAAEAAAVREAEAVAWQAAEQAKPCADCGTPDAGGLCTVCVSTRATEEAIARAGDVAAAAAWDGEDLDQAVDVAAGAQARLREQLAAVRGQALAEGALPEVAALMVRMAAETAMDEHRAEALQVLARARQADGEAWQAAEAERRSYHKLADVAAAAEQAATDARARTAAHLLTVRTAEFAATRARRAAEEQAGASAPAGPAAAGTCGGRSGQACGVPVTGEFGELCGRCHAQQLTQRRRRGRGATARRRA